MQSLHFIWPSIFWQKSYPRLEKYLLSAWGNPLEYEKKLRENVENVQKAAASLVTIIPIVISRDRGFRVYNSVLLSFFIGQGGGHLVGRFTYH